MHIIGAYVAFIVVVYVQLDCTQHYEQVDALILRLSMEPVRDPTQLMPEPQGIVDSQELNSQPMLVDSQPMLVDSRELNTSSPNTRSSTHRDPFINKYTLIFSVVFMIGLILFAAWVMMGSPIHYTTDNGGLRWENGDSGVNYEWRTASKEHFQDGKHMGYKYGNDMNLMHGVKDVNPDVIH